MVSSKYIIGSAKCEKGSVKMKLFENKVGRPSNKILKKRKKFYLSIIVLSLICFVSGGIVFYNLQGKSLKASAINASCKISRDDNIFSWVCTSGYVKSVFVYNDNAKEKNSSILNKIFNSNKQIVAKYANTTYGKSNRISISNFYDGYRVVFNLSDGKTEEISNFNGETGTKKTKINQVSSPLVYYTWDSSKPGSGTIHYFSYGTRATSYRIYMLDENEKIKKSYKKVNIKTINNHVGTIDISDLSEDDLYKVEITFKKGSKTYKESKIITSNGPKYITVVTQLTSSKTNKDKAICTSNKKFKVKYESLFNVLAKNNCNLSKIVYYVVKPNINNLDEELVYNSKTKLWYSGKIYDTFTNSKIKFSDLNPEIDFVTIKNSVS